MELRHESVIPNPDLPFRIFIFEGMNGNYQVGKHWHRSLELFAVLEGDIRFYINSKQYYINDGDVLLVNPNEVHYIEAPTENQVVVVQIPFAFLKPYCENGYIRFRQFDSRQDALIFKKINELYDIYQQKPYGYELLVKSKMLEFLHLLITSYRRYDLSEEWLHVNRNIEKLAKVTEYIWANYNQELSLKGVAEEFGFSSTYLSKMFQKYAGVNYKAYLQSIRVEYGYQELISTEKNICDIAYDNGFPNSKSFSKTFALRYGLLPGEYRKMYYKRWLQANEDKINF